MRSNGVFVSSSCSFFFCGYLKRLTAETLLPEIGFNCDHDTVSYVIWFRTTFVKHTDYTVLRGNTRYVLNLTPEY